MGTSSVALRQDERAIAHVAEQSVTTGTPVSIYASPASRAAKLVIQVLDNSVSLRDDGGVPSATTGLIIPANDIYVIEASPAVLQNIAVIGVSGTARIRLAVYGF